MDRKILEARACPGLNMDSVIGLILDLQRTSGEIPWHTGGKTDPWDLVESAMGLNIGGRHDQAARAFGWLKENQNPDGSWYSAYRDGVPEDRTSETNMAAYIATGVFHAFLIRRNPDFAESMWETIRRAVDFSISLQTERGEIFWAKSPRGDVDPMALLTGCSSIYMSLKCALALAGLLGRSMPRWEDAFDRLGRSIRDTPHIYNISKSRFSMYWFYPVLSGALTGEAAERRIDKYWKRYVVEGQGVRCVSDRPWITMAETPELVLDGTVWGGYTFPGMVIWPEEKISWTNAVVLMAADALYGLTPASAMFNHDSWDGFRYLG